MNAFNGLGLNLGNLSRLSAAQTRSISPENFNGAKGAAGMATEGTGAPHARGLGQGWKVSPSVRIKIGETFTVADIAGSGAIQQIWMTPTGPWRFSILRIYWDDQEQPSVGCPVGDFFGAPWGTFAPLVSLPVCVNPGSAFNSYWEMPFRQRCRITLSNIGHEDMTLYYQINYTLTDVPADCAYFHAQFRRTNPLPFKTDYTILDGVKGQGQFVGTAMGWGVNNSRWWGEGEIKFFMDGDKPWPTICGTGTEDYFCGAWNYAQLGQAHCTPYYGYSFKGNSDYTGKHSQYRFHVEDPVYFEQSLRFSLEHGHANDKQGDWTSTAYWYQIGRTQPLPEVGAFEDRIPYAFGGLERCPGKDRAGLP